MSGPIVIAGGGTGGHVFVAEAVAKALQGRGVEATDLWFVGSERGQERELLAESGIELVLLPGRGIQRSITPVAVLRCWHPVKSSDPEELTTSPSHDCVEGRPR